jgi:hypothetical protein
LNRQLSSKWPQIHEKKFNILNCKGNANQNDIEIPCDPSQNGNHQEKVATHSDKDVGEELLYTLGGNVN